MTIDNNLTMQKLQELGLNVCPHPDMINIPEAR